MLLALGLAAVVLPPLLLRGALLRRVVARATANLCGEVTVDGGAVAWLVVPDLLLGRPFALELDGLRVVAPEGGEVLALERVTADVAVARSPWRAVVGPLTASRGRWRLAIDEAGDAHGFLGAFRARPAGAPRAACFAPAPPHRGPKVPPNGSSFALRDVRLVDLDVTLDFPSWGLTLPRVRATGSLGVGTPPGTAFTFDVRDATAPGGELRVGPGGAAATRVTTKARFDDVAISHVGIAPGRPDLALTVAHADSGRSRLTGTAVFESVVGTHGPGGLRDPPGLSLDARWERIADAAARLDAPWLPRDAVGELLDGTLTARVHGPFVALTARITLDAPRVGVEATIERGARATLDARARELATEPFLDASLRPALGGTLAGRVRLEAAFGGGVDLSVPIAEATLTRRTRAPHRIVFHVGAPRPAPRAEELDLELASARLARGVLRLEGAHARWVDVTARGALTLELEHEAPGAPPAPGRVDARLAVDVPSIARWVPPETASARVTAEARLSGPLDHLRARLAFSPSSSATILGERFRAPTPATASFDEGRRLAVAGLGVERVGGGRLEARGRFDLVTAALGGELRLSRYPLAALPGLESVELPAALGGRGREDTLASTLAGTADAVVAVSGTTARPAFDGRLDLRGVALGGRPLGDGRFRARARGWSLALDGALGAALTLDLGATRGRDGVRSDANVKLADFAIGPWLPAPLSALDFRATGDARVAVVPRRPLAAHAAVRVTSAAGALDLRSDSSGDTVEASARGELDLARLRPLWGRALDEASGAVAVDLATAPRAPIKGSVVVARALALRPAGWPLDLGVEAGGRLEIDGPDVHVPGLALTAADARLELAGDARLDAEAPERTRLALSAHARLDAAALARKARLPGVASATGAISVDARATGELRAPELAGTLRLEAVEVRPLAKGWPAGRVDGVVTAQGRTLTTSGLRVETVGAGLVAGALVVGDAATPARVALDDAWPPRVARVDVPVTARGLRLADPRAALSVGALDLALRLSGDPARGLALTGDVGIADVRFDPFAPAPKGPRGPARPWFEALPPGLSLDLTLHGPPDAVVVNVPVLPDVDLGVRCRVRGDRRHGSITGELRGRGVYSRLMLSLFGPEGASACRVLKE